MELATFTRSDSRSPQAHPIGEAIRSVVLDANRDAPRSLQAAVGPSEVGEPCARRLAYRVMNEPRVNTDSDPWAAIVGTAVHGWLADAFTAANTRLGRIRYLVERRVNITDNLAGSCDLYDADTAAVIDHKVIGQSSMTKYKKDGPPEQYRSQAHLYGLGFTRLGLPVREVSLAFYPRGGMLSGLHVWSEPYDQAIADAALQRMWSVTEAAITLGVNDEPGRYSLIPAEPGHRCTWCPWFKPGAATGRTCSGHLPPSSAATTAE